MAPELEVFMDDVPSMYTVLDQNLLYLVRIQDATVKKASNQAKYPGEPLINVALEVRQPAEWEGKVVYETLSLPMQPTPMDSTAERRRKLERGVRLRQFMEAFKITWGPKSIKTEDWVGMEAGATIRNEEGLNGDLQSRPKKYIPADDARALIGKISASLATPDASGAQVPTTGI